MIPLRLRIMALIALICAFSCVGVRTPALEINSAKKRVDSKKLVVLIDENLALYSQVITGIHVASGGNYRILELQEEGFVQSAFLEQLLRIKPQALIALGPRSANAIDASRVILPSVFSMVPRIENYELGNVFAFGIRMVPDVKEQLSLIRSLMPDLRALGVVFSRQNSRNSIQRVRSLCDEEQFELVNIEVQSTSDVLPALKRYHQEFSAVLMLDDPLLLNRTVIESMISFLSSKQIAFFSLDCSMVKDGALASFGTNFFNLGKDLVRLVSTENNASLYGSTEFVNPSTADVCINLSTAEKMRDKNRIIGGITEFAAQKGIAIKTYR